MLACGIAAGCIIPLLNRKGEEKAEYAYYTENETQWNEGKYTYTNLAANGNNEYIKASAEHNADLFDGKISEKLTFDNNWFSFTGSALQNGSAKVLCDLKSDENISGVRCHVAYGTGDRGVTNARAYVRFSRDGKNWSERAKLSPSGIKNVKWLNLYSDKEIKARYVEFEFTLSHESDTQIFVDEIEVVRCEKAQTFSADFANKRFGRDETFPENSVGIYTETGKTLGSLSGISDFSDYYVYKAETDEEGKNYFIKAAYLPGDNEHKPYLRIKNPGFLIVADKAAADKIPEKMKNIKEGENPIICVHGINIKTLGKEDAVGFKKKNIFSLGGGLFEFTENLCPPELPSPPGGRVMSDERFVKTLKDIADNYKTVYVMGCFGAPMNEKNKERYTHNHAYNMQPERTQRILGVDESTFGFDCVNLIKGILWGWRGDATAVYGGAGYAENGVPDIDADDMIDYCRDVSGDFKNIEVGEAVWKPGHIGVYVGGGMVVECTPAFRDCVQYSYLQNKGYGEYPARTWTKHGKIPYVNYTSIKEVKPCFKKVFESTVLTLAKAESADK